MAKSTHVFGVAIGSVANLISIFPGKNYSQEVQDILNGGTGYLKASKTGDIIQFEKGMEHEIGDLKPGKTLYVTHAIAAIIEYLAFHQESKEVQIFADEFLDTGLIRTFRDLGFGALCVSGEHTFVIKITDKNNVSKTLLGTEKH